MSAPSSLVGMNRAEIAEFLGGGPESKMRASQLATWVYKRAASSYDVMNDVPASLRKELAEKLPINPLMIAKHARSTDDVDKLLVHNGDHQVFECVLLPYRDRVSCCLSSQVGCPMGCTFCATGLGGFDRNLSAGEIVGQYLLLQGLGQTLVGGSPAGIPELSDEIPSGFADQEPHHDDVRGANSPASAGIWDEEAQAAPTELQPNLNRTPTELQTNQPKPTRTNPNLIRTPTEPQPNPTRTSPRRISHVVFMGMGEPLLNLPNLVKAMALLHDEVGLSYRHITVSTVGIVPQIRELAELKLPIHLALSLHSPDDDVRNRLMPVNKRWPVEEVVRTMKDYMRKTGRKITIEYLLIDHLTDSTEQAARLARLISGVPSVVNLIPFNYVATEQGFSRPTRARVNAFKDKLRSLNVNVTERAERGHDIAAACGQLAGEHQGRFALRVAAQ